MNFNSPELKTHEALDGTRWWTFGVVFATKDEAQAYADRFPKYAKVTLSTLSTIEDGEYLTFPTVTSQGTISADKVNKGINETGNKRYDAINKVLRAL